MISIKVRDFRGIERADLVCDPICLLTGRNGSGKTSVVQALGAVLTGNVLPLSQRPDVLDRHVAGHTSDLWLPQLALLRKKGS